jgi:hypothetical protein
MKSTITALILITLGSNTYAQNRAPRPDLTVSTLREMIDLNESSEKYLGKVVKISGAWVSGDHINRSAQEKTYCMDFRFGTSFDASEEFGRSYSPYPIDKSLGYMVDLDDAAVIKEMLKSRKSSSLRTYTRCDLYFKIEKRKSLAFPKLYDKPVGNLVWINIGQ